MSKPWPPESQLADFSDLIDPVRKVLKQGYEIKRKDAYISYTGFDIGDRDKATCLSPDEAFTEEALARSEEYGQDLLDRVLQLAFLLGVEQGRRLSKLEYGH